MRYLRTSEAARLLGVSPSTLRSWEQRFRFPQPYRSPGGHRFYSHGEVVALRAALQEGLSISSAVLRARHALAADTDSLIAAFARYDRGRADVAIETVLNRLTLARAVEEILLRSLDEIARRDGPESAMWAFAARWATDWLHRARLFARPPAGQFAILVGDATRDELDFDAPYIRALELFCVRAGARTLSLCARAVTGIGDAAAVHHPNVLLLAGKDADDMTATRWTSAVQRAVGPVPLALYRRGTDGSGRTMLPSAPGDAQLLLFDRLERDHAARTLGAKRRADALTGH
jgi:DNA-binding transcriptional MerR regulator